MSLNKFTSTQKGQDIGLQIGCETLECINCVCESIVIPTGGDLQAHDIKVDNNLEIKTGDEAGFVNYKTADLGQPNYSLHTDGAGIVFWSPDDTGSSDLSFDGTTPVSVGQFIKFKTTDAKTVKESKLIEDATNLSLGALNIINVGNVDGVSISSLSSQVGTNASNITTLQGDRLKIDGTLAMTGDLDMNSNNISNVVNINGSSYPPVPPSDASKLSIDGSIAMTGDLDMGGQSITNVNLVDGEDVSAVASQVGTNTSNISSNSSAILTKLDKDGIDNARISNATPTLTLKDNLSVGASNGELSFTDSVNSNIVKVSGVGGNLILSRAGVPKMEIKSSETKSNQNINMNDNDIFNVNEVSGNTDGLQIVKLSGEQGGLGLEVGVDDSYMRVPLHQMATFTMEGNSRVSTIDNFQNSLIGQSQNNFVVNAGGVHYFKQDATSLMEIDNTHILARKPVDIFNQSLILDTKGQVNVVNTFNLNVDIEGENIDFKHDFAVPAMEINTSLPYFRFKKDVKLDVKNLVLTDGQEVNVSGSNTVFNLTNNSNGSGVNIGVHPSENIFFKSLNFQNGVNTVFPFTNTNDIGSLSSQLKSLYTRNINNVSTGNPLTIGNVSDKILLNGQVEALLDLRQYKTFFPSTLGIPVNSSFYRMITSKTISNTTTETSLYDDTGALGTRTTPPNSLGVGSSFRTVLTGTIDTQGNQNITFRLKLNGITVATTGAISLNADPLDFWKLETDFCIRTTGVGGTAVGTGRFSHKSGQGSITVASPVVIDTTITNTIDFTAEWATADLNNIIKAQIGYVDSV